MSSALQPHLLADSGLRGFYLRPQNSHFDRPVADQSATSAIEHVIFSARMSEKDKFRPK
jgi:hypothetical protein